MGIRNVLELRKKFPKWVHVLGRRLHSQVWFGSSAMFLSSGQGVLVNTSSSLAFN